jgi:hypothetical protein
MRKDRLDGFGLMMLLGVQGLLAVNQILIKLVNQYLQPVHILGLLFQSFFVLAGSCIAWLWLSSVGPGSTVASFPFLTPVLALVLGAVIYGQTLTWSILPAAALIAAGVVPTTGHPGQGPGGAVDGIAQWPKMSFRRLFNPGVQTGHRTGKSGTLHKLREVCPQTCPHPGPLVG